MTTTTLIIGLCSIAACVRLLTFRRSGTRHKRCIAITAWLVTSILGAVAIRSLTGGLPESQEIQMPLLASLITFTALIFKARGNLARIVSTLTGESHA